MSGEQHVDLFGDETASLQFLKDSVPQRRSRRGNPLVIILLIAVISVFVMSWLISYLWPGKIQMYDNSELMQQEITKHIPIGSSIDRAREVLEANSFRCYQDNVYLDGAWEQGIPLPSFDQRSWHVRIYHKYGAVSKVEVRFHIREWTIVG